MKPRTGTPLREGQLVYHGTSADEDFEDLRGPAWVSDSWKVAKNFVGWNAGSRPRVITYRVISPPVLALVDDRYGYREYDELREWVEEETGLGTDDVHEFADAVCSARLGGWHIPKNYPEGSDTLICDPSAVLEFVKAEKVVTPTSNPPKARVVLKKVRRTVGKARACYPAAEVVYHAGGGRRAGLTPVQQKHEGVSHWWVRGPKGEVLDPASAQFRRPVPYERGRGRGFLTAKPSRRARALAKDAGVRMNPHFLDSTHDAIKWALKNVGDAREDYPAGSSSRAVSYRMRKEMDVETYVAEYHGVMAAGQARIWRAVEIPAGEDPRLWIDWDEVGTHWSFRRRGAGVYSGGKVQGPTRVVVIEAVVQVAEIDWEYGFTSFWYYGEDQFECALVPGAKVEVVAINGASVAELTAKANPGVLVPIIPQRVDDDGAAACARSVLMYLGLDAPLQEKLVGYMDHGDDQRVMATVIRRISRANGVEVRTVLYDHMSADEMSAHLNEGRPVVLRLAPRDDGERVVVACGFDEESVIVMDPALEAYVPVPWSALKQRPAGVVVVKYAAANPGWIRSALDR